MGEKHARVSIVTVVKNASGTIARAMESVLSQSYGDVEYIVIDGGSEDGTQQVVQRFESRLAYWTSEPDRGIADAFNKGIAKATGQWVGMLNADDWYERDAVQRSLAASSGAAVVHGWLRYWHVDGSSEIWVPTVRAMKREMTLAHPTCFVRRDMYERYGGFDASFQCAMDYEFLLRLHLAGERFTEVGSVTANMRAGGMSQVGWRLGRQEERRAKIKNGKRPMTAWLEYGWVLGRRQVRLALQRAGLEGVVSAYRARYTPVRKLRDREQ